MAEGSNDDALMKSLAHLKSRALDVKFDLDTTDYVPQENIGTGAYGVVCSAIHKKTNDRVAIKKIPSVFDIKDVAKRTYREIKILKHFKHDNIIHIREILKPATSLSDLKDVYVVFDLMESDLHRIIYSKQELTEEHVRYFLYQILRGLKYIHSAHVIHRDLKPSNLLVNEDCQLRIGDFGMARGVSSSPQEPNYFMTQYVATRWFRAPEIMLSLVEYGTAVDMWSVGCIFAEMLGRKPLFPGKNYISQIRLIVGMVGSPKEDLLKLCHSPIIKNYLKELGHKDPVPWTKLFPNASKKAINLLSRMLVLHPRERMTVEQALVHPYLNKYHDPDDEPICVPAFDFDFEKQEIFVERDANQINKQAQMHEFVYTTCKSQEEYFLYLKPKDMSIPEIREAIHQEAMEYHQPRTHTFSFNAFLRPVPKPPGDKPPESGFLHISKGDSTLTDSGDKEKTTQQMRDTSEEPNQQVPVLKADGEVFKKPLSAKNDDPQVTIDTSGNLKVDSQDVEMLSAKSTDGKEAKNVVAIGEKPKENREPGRGNKQLISKDTKALVKAALANPYLRKQRLDSVGEDDKARPVTAAMRQREREEKRKKKKEKSAERRRKEKMKKGKESEERLTSEDKEHLMRWAKMHKANVPIAPKPEIEVKSDSVLVSQKLMHTGLNMNSIHVSSGVHTNGPVKSVSMNAGGQSYGSQGHDTSVSREGQGSKSITQMFGRTVHKGPAAQQETLSLLQQHLRSQGQAEQNGKSEGQRNVIINDGDAGRNETEVQHATNFRPVKVEENKNSSSSNVLEQPKSSSNYSVDFSTVNLGDLDFLTMISSPTSEMNCSATTTNYTSVTSVNDSKVLPKIEVVPEVPINSDISNGGFLQNLCSENINTQVYPPNTDTHTFPPHSCQQSVSPSHISPNSQPASPQQFFNSHSPQNLSPNQLKLSPEGSSFVPQPQIRRNSPEVGQNVSQNRVSPVFGYQDSTAVPTGLVPTGLSVSQPFSQNMTVASYASHFPASTCSSTNIVQQQGFSTCMNTSNIHVHPHQRLNQPSQMNSQVAMPFSNYINTQPNTRATSKFESSPGLFVNTKQAQMPYRQLFQDAVPGPSGVSSHAGSQIQESQLDLMALVKQLSKSNMEDLCPPLALTPKGTGGGYGVGVDIDSLMVVSQDGEGTQPEPSPLSSSILADWMDVTGNMNIDMDALEQELQSPMALSYSDINLYSS